MFLLQSVRYFPLPDYELSSNRVKLKLTGKVLNIDYARLLASTGDLTLSEIMVLDNDL